MSVIMNAINKNILLLVLVFLAQSCSRNLYQQTLIVYNNLDMFRVSETVLLKKSLLKRALQENFENMELKDVVSNEILPIQFVDTNNDNFKDALLFQPKLGPKQSKTLSLTIRNADRKRTLFDTIAFSKFVPERIDDYAWENDRVAFRMYGPEAENLVKSKLEGGTLSSGIDCWLKRVKYPIITKWYKKYIEGTGSYHDDTGEGLDNFHVGKSRGCGGIGVLSNDTLYTSANFTKFSLLENGPIRTNFILIYAPWNTGKVLVTEHKKISLDTGSNLTRFEIVFDKEIDTIVVGLPLHKMKEEIASNKNDGWFSVWKEHYDSELGMGIVVDPKYLIGDIIVSNEKNPESNHLFVQLKPIDNKVVYYAGFGWKKSGQFNTIKEWYKYLDEFSMKLHSPIRLKIK